MVLRGRCRPLAPPPALVAGRQDWVAGLRDRRVLTLLQHCRRIVMAFLAIAVGVSAHAGDALSRRATGPRVGPAALPMSTPEEQGVDSKRLAAAVDFLSAQRERYDVHSVTVVRHGHVVADVSF